MAEAAFFYNFTTQRPDLSKPPSAHTNISYDSQAQPLRPIFKTSRSASTSSSNPGPKNLSKDNKGAAQDDDRMLSTPLLNYKHAANQTIKERNAAQQQRKSSSTSGGSSERRNAAQQAGGKPARSGSISSATNSSGLTAVSSNDIPPPDVHLLRPFARRNGRRVLRDTTLPYPLPCDLTELHRQTLRTMLLCQVFNGPVCSPAFEKKPPKRVLEVGCGTGFWSVMCHRHFAARGFPGVSFTGIDIAPLPPAMRADDDMSWRFVQHDLRKTPLPFREAEFGLIMVKDMSLCISDVVHQQNLMDEYLRILKPGGTLELWDGDHSLRMLLPHAPPEGKEEDEEQEHANAMGTYTLTPQTPLAAPQNPFFQDYNSWIAKALEVRNLTPMPCTLAQASLHQESELVEIDSRRLAVPLGLVRWEREGVGPAKGGKGKEKVKVLTAGQAALRMTALLTVVQFIESLEGVLREVSGKGQDEWDRWYGATMADLLKGNGTSWGECLEVGAWWARKKKAPS